MTYKIILADPPWQYSDKSLNKGGAERHYPTLTLEEMAELNVVGLADKKESALCMWVTFPQLENAINLIRAWGFSPVTCLFNWVKLNRVNQDPETPFVGMGHYTRSNAEIMLLCRRGKTGKIPARQTAKIRQIQYFPVTKHSAKPPEFRDLLVELFGDVPRVELFARNTAPGWDCWGNEVESNVSLRRNPFKSIKESLTAAVKKQKVKIANDFRGICPKCFNHNAIGSNEADDGGSFIHKCDCGFIETSFSLSHMESSIKETFKRLSV